MQKDYLFCLQSLHFYKKRVNTCKLLALCTIIHEHLNYRNILTFFWSLNRTGGLRKFSPLPLIREISLSIIQTHIILLV